VRLEHHVTTLRIVNHFEVEVFVTPGSVVLQAFGIDAPDLGADLGHLVRGEDAAYHGIAFLPELFDMLGGHVGVLLARSAISPGA
jgi:hypothetical protein